MAGRDYPLGLKVTMLISEAMEAMPRGMGPQRVKFLCNYTGLSIPTCTRFLAELEGWLPAGERKAIAENAKWYAKRYAKNTTVQDAIKSIRSNHGPTS